MLNKSIDNYLKKQIVFHVFSGLLQYIISKAKNADHLTWTESEDTTSFQESCLHWTWCLSTKIFSILCFLYMMSYRAVLVVYSSTTFPPLRQILILNLSNFALFSILWDSIINEIERMTWREEGGMFRIFLNI